MSDEMERPGRQGLTFRQDYFADPAAWKALANLLQTIFGIDVTVLEPFGGPDPTSMLFAWFDQDSRCIANITAFSLPLVIDGVVVNAAGLQSGAVRPSHRGLGLYRDVLVAALAHCDAAGFEAVALLTDTPDLYRRHGFRALAQHKFTGPPPTPVAGAAGPVRRLDTGNEDDVALLYRLLRGRKPVSARFAPLRQAEMFLFNAVATPDLRLDLMEDRDVVIAWRSGDDGRFELLDIVGAHLPSLADIVASLKVTPGRVTVHFAPDRLDGDLGEAVADASGMILMLRCRSDLQPKQPFVWPPLAEF